MIKMINKYKIYNFFISAYIEELKKAETKIKF